ncbi:hypothetical protein C8Q76DRAFT_747948 [Earliella scabrosa]|nr:hypothetical protein C8Q76DRAFT_747948 [Earliella scabrosa]
MVAAWDIYAKELLPLGYGHPLWGPEPSLEFGEVHLGDVGYLREGRFCFLFNALKPADSPAHEALGVPEDFQIFKPPHLMLKQRQNEITQRQLHNKNLQSTAIAAAASVGCVCMQRFNETHSYTCLCLQRGRHCGWCRYTVSLHRGVWCSAAV